MTDNYKELACNPEMWDMRRKWQIEFLKSCAKAHSWRPGDRYGICNRENRNYHIRGYRIPTFPKSDMPSRLWANGGVAVVAEDRR